jgi:hypothetical protein
LLNPKDIRHRRLEEKARTEDREEEKGGRIG